MQERITDCVLQIIADSPGTRGEGAYLIDVSVKGPQRNRKIEVLIDDDAGVRIDQCAWLSRRIRERLEADDELLEMVGEDFELTVSSPGLGEPILLPRQYQRHTGRLLQVTYSDEEGRPTELLGRLLQVSLSEEGGAFIVIQPEKNKKKGQQPTSEGITIYLTQVLRAVPEAEL